MPHGGQEGGGVLPNGGGREQRERLPFFSSPLFSSFNCHPFRSKLSPSFSFPALSPLFKKTLPGKLIVSGIHRHKWSGAAACAWGAGDTKPGQPTLLPTPEGLRQRHAHGRNYTIVVFSFYFFIFVGIQKWVTTPTTFFPNISSIF
jgi:hypothetical protein